MTLKLANDCRYTPDFFVMNKDGGFECHEVKGSWIRDDAIVKLRVTADQWPDFVFKLCVYKQGIWTIKVVKTCPESVGA